MKKYILAFICTVCSMFGIYPYSICEAQNLPIARINYLQYNLDLEHYEKINEQDYYMYIEAIDINTKDACVLHIMTNREEQSYIVTDSIIRTHHGFIKSCAEYEKGTYNDSSIVGKAVELLDKHEEELKEESKV